MMEITGDRPPRYGCQGRLRRKIKIGTARPPLHLAPHEDQKYHHEQDEVGED